MPDQDLTTMLDAEWQKAQQRAEVAKSRGLSEAETDAIYLAPARAKAFLFRTSPQLFQDKSNRSKINAEFDAETLGRMNDALVRPAAVPRMTGRGARAQVAAEMPSADNLKSMVDKWRGEATLGKEVKKTDLAQLQLLKHQRGLAEKERSKYDWALQNAHPQKDEDVEGSTANFDVRKQNYQSHLAMATSDLETITPKIEALVSGKPELAQAGDALPDTAPAPEVQTPFNRPNTFNPLPDHVPSDSSMIASNPFDEFRQQPPQAAPAMTAPPMPVRNNGQFFISGQDGKPDLTNYEGALGPRAAADAAWAARTAPRISPPADTAPVERTAAAVNADNALVAVINPQGKRVRIKQSQLDDALTQGYTEP